MKKLINKIKCKIDLKFLTIAYVVMLSTKTVSAEGLNINTELGIELFNSLVDPVTIILSAIIGGCMVLAWLKEAISYFQLDKEERDGKKIFKQFENILKVGLLSLCVPLILQVFGFVL